MTQTTIGQIVEDAIAKQMAIKENFVAHYLAATGAKIERTMLVEQRSADGLTTNYWCEPKKGRPKHVKA